MTEKWNTNKIKRPRLLKSWVDNDCNVDAVTAELRCLRAAASASTAVAAAAAASTAAPTASAAAATAAFAVASHGRVEPYQHCPHATQARQ